MILKVKKKTQHESSNQLGQKIIGMLQQHIRQLGFTPVIHFELEGCYQSPQRKTELNYTVINQQLRHLNIDGKVIPEYWHQQWEFVSLFNGQSPLKEADNLSRAIKYLPQLFAKQGIEKTLIKPVVWRGDQGKLAQGCDNIFTNDERAVHIPNAIQMNISVNNSKGDNIICHSNFGEYLQQCFMQTSLSCSLLYLPEEEAFERFALKTKYGLAKELCSPDDISGGHQGSVALYKELGKHNQAMGEEPLLYDHHHNVVAKAQCWQKTARIEHRLGASSRYYNAYVNVIYGLLNIIDALEVFLSGNCHNRLNSQEKVVALPLSLQSKGKDVGAIELFNSCSWFANRINEIDILMTNNNTTNSATTSQLGDKLKAAILADYQIQPIITD